ncbi:hypothetical protein PAXRUDRAFT_36320 [Paxillus rubicundulus Ve08.2h10]|uniref:Uncharacterized protein n=1 Tax=Paxillus rubicundulus Ve08.2h10 TaxID=930991 RepID=A0A0D0D8G3_9AGAM|nr:hypothetical protein PAXRUDRAFT_36320 [Paxillus rubicundulus Ve08.2h10]
MPRISHKKSSDSKALSNIPTQPADYILENKKEWTTHEQKAFLLEELVEYKKLTTREYHRQWPGLYQCWPERNYVPELKDLPATEALTDQQSTVLVAAIDKNQMQLQSWLRWHSGAGRNRLANSKTNKLVDSLMKPQSHIKQLGEIYPKTFYKSHVKLDIDSIKIEESLKSEPQHIQEEVRCMREEQVSAKKRKRASSASSDDEEESALDAQEIQSNIQQCGPTLQQILAHMAKRTGWMFTILMGGLDPMDPKGESVVVSLHVGENKLGYNSGAAYSRFDMDMVQAYTEFLDDVYGLEVKLAVLTKTSGDSANHNPREAAGEESSEEEEENGEEGGGKEDDEGEKDEGEGERNKGKVMGAESTLYTQDRQNIFHPDGAIATPLHVASSLHVASFPPVASPPIGSSLPVASSPPVASSLCIALSPPIATPLICKQDVSTVNTTTSQHMVTPMQSLVTSPPSNFPDPQALRMPFNSYGSQCISPGTQLLDPFQNAGSFGPNLDNLVSFDFSFMLMLNNPVPGLDLAPQWGNGIAVTPQAVQNFNFLQNTPAMGYRAGMFDGSHLGYHSDGVSQIPSSRSPTDLHLLPLPPSSDAQSPNPLGDVPVQPAPVLPPTEPGVIKLPESNVPAVITNPDNAASAKGQSKHKSIPSQHAQRDNATGDLGKRMRQKPKKKSKHPAADEVNEGAKKSK